MVYTWCFHLVATVHVKAVKEEEQQQHIRFQKPVPEKIRCQTHAKWYDTYTLQILASILWRWFLARVSLALQYD